MRVHQHQRWRPGREAKAALRYDDGTVAGTGGVAPGMEGHHSGDGSYWSVLETSLEHLGRRVRVAAGQSAASQIDTGKKDRLQRWGSDRGSIATWAVTRQFRGTEA